MEFVIVPDAGRAVANEGILGSGGEDEGAFAATLKTEMMGEALGLSRGNAVFDLEWAGVVEKNRNALVEAVAAIFVLRSFVGHSEAEREGGETAGKFFSEDLTHATTAMNAPSAVGPNIEELSGPGIGEVALLGIEDEARPAWEANRDGTW